MSNMVRNPEDQFSRVAAHLQEAEQRLAFYI